MIGSEAATTKGRQTQQSGIFSPAAHLSQLRNGQVARKRARLCRARAEAVVGQALEGLLGGFIELVQVGGDIELRPVECADPSGHSSRLGSRDGPPRREPDIAVVSSSWKITKRCSGDHPTDVPLRVADILGMPTPTHPSRLAPRRRLTLTG